MPEPQEKTTESAGLLPEFDNRLPVSGFVLSAGLLDLDQIGADILVNPSDARFSGSGGMDRMVHEKAEPALGRVCQSGLPRRQGDVWVTGSFGLSTRWIAHAAVPYYTQEHEPLLEHCYYACLDALEKRVEQGARSIALPLLGCGTLGWPVQVSMGCAWRALLRFAENSTLPDNVILKIRLCATQTMLPYLEPYMKSRSNVFFVHPQHWKSEGDRRFWFYLMSHTFSPRRGLSGVLESEELMSPFEIKREINAAHLDLTGAGLLYKPEMHADCIPTVSGGEDGVITSEFWYFQGFPLISDTFYHLWPESGKNQDDPRFRARRMILPGAADRSVSYTWVLQKALGESLEKQQKEFFPVPEPQPGNEQQPCEPKVHTSGMRYTPLVKKALDLCFAAHAQQRDKSGQPYVFHPFHLAEQMDTEDEICTALLHDVIEDSDYTLEDLKQAGFPSTVLQALALLTHDETVPYMRYVAELRKNPIARKVKLADLAHNSDPARMKPVTEQDFRRLQKYRIAKAILADAPYDAMTGYYCKKLPLNADGSCALQVFYRLDGKLGKYRLNLEATENACYEFDGENGEKLRRELKDPRSLPEVLADLTAEHEEKSIGELMTKLGIQYRVYYLS